MTSRWARLIRGQVVAVFASFVAAFSHGVADGSHPPLVAVALALAFSSVVCVFLSTPGIAAAHLSRTRLAASVAISQLIYHGLFSLFGAAGSSPGIVASGHHGSISFTTSLPGTAAQAAALSTDQWMLAAHFGAAVVTFALLLRGERSLLAVGSVARLIVASLSWWRLPHIPDSVPSGSRFPTGHRAELPHSQLILTSSLSYRGPPASLRFA